MKKILATFIFVSLLLPCLAHAEPNIYKILYSGLMDIESFGHISVNFEDELAQKKGLKIDELTDYIKLRFKNNFGKIKYSKVPLVDDVKMSKREKEKVGILTCRVWVLGNNDYPIATHVICKAGNYNEYDIWHNEALAVVNQSHLLKSIKEDLNALIEGCATAFFKARGEL